MSPADRHGKPVSHGCYTTTGDMTTIGQEPGVQSYLAAKEFELQSVFEIDLQMRLLGVVPGERVCKWE